MSLLSLNIFSRKMVREDSNPSLSFGTGTNNNIYVLNENLWQPIKLNNWKR